MKATGRLAQRFEHATPNALWQMHFKAQIRCLAAVPSR